jgi:hypothetical protein
MAGRALGFTNVMRQFEQLDCRMSQVRSTKAAPALLVYVASREMLRQLPPALNNELSPALPQQIRGCIEAPGMAAQVVGKVEGNPSRRLVDEG